MGAEIKQKDQKIELKVTIPNPITIITAAFIAIGSEFKRIAKGVNWLAKDIKESVKKREWRESWSDD